MDRIYLDNASTTPLSGEVFEAMLPFLRDGYGNASSVHGTGRDARRAVDKARRQTARAIGAEAREIYFTSGGSESDNWAIAGAYFAWKEKNVDSARPGHIITTAIEHHAVLHTCQWLERLGAEVTYLPVDRYGMIDPEKLKAAIRSDTLLITVMTANNEIGTIEPIEEVSGIARDAGILFHTDAVQAAGALKIDAAKAGVDLLSLSAHKFNGPKGVGALYIRAGTKLEPLIHGGAQERGQRAGTENTAGIVGMGEALERAAAGMEERENRVRALRDRLIEGTLHRIPGAMLNGHPTRRLPGNCNVSIPGVDGEALLLRLDLEGIACSSGSACTSGSQEPSHVLRAIGLSEEQEKGSLRLTIGGQNTEEEIDETLEALVRITADLRSMRL